jgi:ribonuclease P protein component
MVVYGLSEAGSVTRLGLSASRKVGGAVARNRIRRRLSEIFRSSGAKLPAGTSVIIIARPGIVEINYHNMEIELTGLVNRLAAALNKEAADAGAPVVADTNI